MSSESELRRFLLQVWIWRLRIAVFFIGVALFTIAYLFLIAEPKYRLSVTFEPGKVPLLSESEKSSELLVSPKSILYRIQMLSYDPKIRRAAELNQDLNLNWSVSQPRDTDLIMVSINWSDVEQGEKILFSLVSAISDDLKQRTKIYREKLGFSANIYKRSVDEIEKKIQLSEEDASKLKRELNLLREHSNLLRSNQLGLLGEKRGELSVEELQTALIYNSVVQDNMAKSAEVAQQLNELEMNIRDLYESHETKLNQLNEILLTLDNLVEVEMIGDVSVSGKPVQPKKTLTLVSVLALACVLLIVIVQLYLTVSAPKERAPNN
jgi:hypothetical protein